MTNEERSPFSVSRIGAAPEIIFRDLDGGLGHEILGGALNERDGNLRSPRFTRGLVLRNVSPGFTWVNATGSSVISTPLAVRRATVNRDVASSPGSGKSERKCAPRDFRAS